MRLAVVSDVHANLQALEATLTAVESLGVDAIACPGDLVGYGPSPNECVRRINQTAAWVVAGNHDLIALGRLADDRCIPLARRSLSWTRDVLAADARETLTNLPLTAHPVADVLVAHGTPDDPQAYVHTPAAAAAVLAAADVAVRIVIVGHTHRWMAYGERRGALPVRPGDAVSLGAGERMLLNAGSVGQSRERLARARFMVLDLERGAATFHEVAYDLRATRRALRSSGLSPRGVHLYPSLARRLGRRARRVLPG